MSCTVLVEDKPCGRPDFRKDRCKAHHFGREPRCRGSHKTEGVCKVAGCSRQVHSKGLCNGHYQRSRKGDLRAKRPIKEYLGDGVKWSRDSVYLPRQVVEYIEAHAKSRGMSIYLLKREIYLGWYKEKVQVDGTPQLYEDVVEKDRQQQLLELLDGHYYGMSKLAIHEAMSEDYPLLLQLNSASERKFYRDVEALGLGKTTRDGVVIYSHPQHLHRIIEEVDS